MFHTAILFLSRKEILAGLEFITYSLAAKQHLHTFYPLPYFEQVQRRIIGRTIRKISRKICLRKLID